MTHLDHTLTKKERRARRIRARLVGTAQKPRVTIYRSNRYVWLQAIDDQSGKVIASTNNRAIAAKKDDTKTTTAVAASKQLSELLKEKKITAAVFDRGFYRYHGRVAAVAQALRDNGIQV